MAFSSLAYMQLIRSAPLSVAQKAVLYTILSYVDKEGVCWPGTRRICEEAGVSQSTLSRAILKAVDMQILATQGRKNRATIYKLVLPQRVGVLPQRVEGVTPAGRGVTPAGRGVTPAGFIVPAGVAEVVQEVLQEEVQEVTRDKYRSQKVKTGGQNIEPRPGESWEEYNRRVLAEERRKKYRQ